MIKEYKELLHEFIENLPKFLKYELITKGVLSLIIIPLFGFVSDILISLHGAEYSANTSTFRFFFTPEGALFFLLLLITIIAEIQIEIAGYVTISCQIESKSKESGFWDIFKYNLKILPRMMSVGGLIIFVYVLLLAPISGFGFHIKFMGGFDIAHIIKDLISGNPIYTMIYWIIAGVMLYLSFKIIFVFHFMIVHDFHAMEALKASWKIVKKNKKKFAIDLVAISVFNLLFTGIAVIIWLLFIVLAARDTNLSTVTGRSFMSFLLIIQNIGIFIATSLLVPFEVFHITKAYYMFIGKESERCLVIKPKKKDNIFDKIFRKKKTVFFLVILASAIVAVPMGTFTKEILGYNENIKIFADGGYGYGYPENSIEAIEESIKKKIDYVELSVRKCKDGRFVLNKDKTFSKVAVNYPEIARKKIEDLDFRDIEKLKIGKNSKVATLEKALNICQDRIRMSIDLRGKYTRDDIDKIMSLIKNMGMKSNVIISSIDTGVINYIEDKDSSFNTGLIYVVSIGDMSLIRADYLMMEKDNATEDLIEEAKESGKKVVVGILNSVDDMEKFFKMDIDGVITDRPVFAKNLMRDERQISEKDLLLSSFIESLTESKH